MIEVFISDIRTLLQADGISKTIQKDHPGLQVNFDLNERDLPFPCGHTVLRVEGNSINSSDIIATLNNRGFTCEILEDKICTS